MRQKLFKKQRNKIHCWSLGSVWLGLNQMENVERIRQRKKMVVEALFHPGPLFFFLLIWEEKRHGKLLFTFLSYFYIIRI